MQYQNDEIRRATIAPKVIHIDGPRCPVASETPASRRLLIPFREITSNMTKTTIMTRAETKVTNAASKSLPRRKPLIRVMIIAKKVRPRPIQYRIKFARNTLSRFCKPSTAAFGISPAASTIKIIYMSDPFNVTNHTKLTPVVCGDWIAALCHLFVAPSTIIP